MAEKPEKNKNLEELIPKLPAVLKTLNDALAYPKQFTNLARKNKTFSKELSFSELLSWLRAADKIYHAHSDRHLWGSKENKERFGLGKLDLEISRNKEAVTHTLLADIQKAYQLALFINDLHHKDSSSILKAAFRKKPAPEGTRKSRHIGRKLTINGIDAVDLDVTRSANLKDPILNINLKVNNPIDRLWAAIKRLWKNQKTVVGLKITIPLLVLPLVLFLLYSIWQGRGAHQPFSKAGIIHEVRISGKRKDILLSPTSNVYTLSYKKSFPQTKRILEKPVIVIGTHNNLESTVFVDDIIAWDYRDLPQPVPKSSSSLFQSIWETTQDLFQRF